MATETVLDSVVTGSTKKFRPGGKIVFELFNDVAPNTVANFVGLCTGQYGKSKRSGLPLSYKGCHFFKIVPGSIVQSGDFEFNNGEGGESIFGGRFHNESMLRRHCQAGVLSMVSDDKKSVGSQFIITLHRASQYDGKQVVFGQLIEGMDVLRAIEKCPITSTHCPKVPIIITDCGIEKKKPGKRRNDPKNEMREAVELLMSTVTTCPSTSKIQPLSEAQRGLRKLQQVLENSKEQKEPVSVLREIQINDFTKKNSAISHSTFDKKEPTNLFISPASSLTSEEPPRCESALEKKLYLLRQKMNQEKHLIAKEVAAECTGLNEFHASNTREEEKRIIKEIKRSTKLALPPKKDGTDCEVSSDESSLHFVPKEKRQKKKGEWSNKETAEMIQWRDKLLKKKKANAQSAFGWAIMNSDASYEAHKKNSFTRATRRI
ncbi:uncharacterized protein LOC128883223 isoform X2 [Hylaeus volcanicus]|uniref:uncharacterized protein LOC128883223 isoform X2 n=1 Tax=Hylaeus volcanicus TaxID=313075 RepID=UPI0023B80FDD|nr:uncharacterized protein LOC128883223 isoform X2 [Hylaeus volcanicus]